MGEGKVYVQNILYEILKIIKNIIKNVIGLLVEILSNIQIIFVNMGILMLLFLLIHESECLSIICVLSLVSFPVPYHFIELFHFFILGYYIFIKALFISTLNNLLLVLYVASHLFGVTTATVLVAEGLCIPG